MIFDLKYEIGNGIYFIVFYLLFMIIYIHLYFYKNMIGGWGI